MRRTGEKSPERDRESRIASQWGAKPVASVGSLSLEAIDVSGPQLYQNDVWQTLFARLRVEDPVHYCADSDYGPYWSLTKYDNIANAELDHATFSSSSELGGIQIEDRGNGGREIVNFIRMDPPEHTAHRKAIAPIVAPTNLANFEPLIRERTAGVLDVLPRNEIFDWGMAVYKIGILLLNLVPFIALHIVLRHAS